MADGIVSVPNSGSAKVDTEELVVGANTVERQRVQLAGSAAAAVVSVLNTAPAGTEYGVLTRNIPTGTQTVAGTILAQGAAAAGAAVTGSPVLMGASDGTLAQTLNITAKGSQGARGLTTQDLKDAGRSQVMVAWEEMTGTAAAESALTNFTLGSRAAAALTAATSLTVTAGKTLRIQSVSVYVKSTSTVNNLARLRIRQAATVANSSPVIFDTVLGLDAPGTIAAGLLKQQVISFPDGLEVAGGQQIAFTWFTGAITCTVGMSIIGYEY